ncbi:MAG TPA: FAD-dependent oxidoreductase [Dongiaceae bacterium]|nr:FAD-dependent oxidoreductase [Dongiaceae bacterium]
MDAPNDPQVLIVGAGPAGLAAARALADHDVTEILIIDRDDAPGGLPRFCHHPGFGLEYARWPYSGPGFARRLLRDLAGTPVRIECRTTLITLRDGPIAEITGPRLGYRQMRPRAIILATGIRESNRGNLLVPGGRAESGILTTGQLQQLVARGVKLPPRLKSAIIVGTEHVAFSAIWTARNAGLRVRAMVGAEDRIMSFAPLGLLARAAGIDVMTGTGLREIVTENGAPSALIVQAGSDIRRLPTDAVIFTANWIPEVATLGGGPVALDPRTGGPEIDQAMRTSAAGIFAAGNMLHGVESSGWCANEGRHAGLMVARYLRGEIAGAQANQRPTLSSDIDILVPQLWGNDADAPPVSLRVSRDLPHRRVAVATDAGQIWTGARRTLLRRRRIAAPSAASLAQASARLSVVD